MPAFNANLAHILPARNIKNMGPRKLWCLSGMGVEEACTFVEGEILGEKWPESPTGFWRDNLTGDSATISLLVIIFLIK